MILFIKNAFSLLRWVMYEIIEGRPVGSLDKETGTFKKLMMPELAGIERENVKT